MKAEDLMIGDWVDVYHELPDESGFYKPLQVTGLHQNNGICFGDSIIESPWNDPEEFEEEIKPIPLTEEILEKNGFGFIDTFNGEYYSVWTGWWILDGLELCCCSNLKFPVYFNISDANVKVNYVHELQHALKLCGIEKEIVL